MNKKVDKEFKFIHDEYLLQCICTEMKDKINKAIDYIKNNISYYYDEDLEDSIYQDEVSGDELLKILGNENEKS